MHTSELVTRSLAHIHHLADEIGPRPAGSPAEATARKYIETCLQSWGYFVQTQSVHFSPLPRWILTHWLAVAGFLTAGWWFTHFPWALLALPFYMSALPELTGAQLRRRARTHQSANLIAYLETGVSASETLLLCAHLDSAPAGRLTGRPWGGLQSRSMDITQRIALLLALFGVLSGAGLSLPGWLTPLAWLVGLLSGGWLAVLQLWGRGQSHGPHAPGANDNASGVGVLLALAEHFAAHPTRQLRLGFLFTGAEETGMHGAITAADGLQSAPTPPRILVIDMVGAGDRLRNITRDGIWRPLATSPELNRRLVHANPLIQARRYTLRSGDHAAFLRAGLPAAALEVTGNPLADLSYHTLNDTPAVIEPPALELTLETLLRLVDGWQTPPRV